MGYQTAEALVERKLRPWRSAGLITPEQFNVLVAYCVEYGFWEALGRSTKLKHRNMRSSVSRSNLPAEGNSHRRTRNANQGRPRFDYLTVFIPKRDLQRVDYVTSGGWSARHRKRRRVWVNGNFMKDGSPVSDYFQNKYPKWTLFKSKPSQGIYCLRRELNQ